MSRQCIIVAKRTLRQGVSGQVVIPAKAGIHPDLIVRIQKSKMD
jgi:hypothetical protein